MMRGIAQFGAPRAFAMFADWTDRIAAGEVPPAPPRPQGIERNVVITAVGLGRSEGVSARRGLDRSAQSDASTPNGLIYGSLELSADYLPVLDPVRNTDQPGAADRPRSEHAADVRRRCRSPRRTGATKPIWTSKNNVHNPMFDEQGRVWITSAVRPSANPDFCKAGSNHPSAKLFPLDSAGRQLAMYDPKTKQLTHISTCFGTHHLMFAEDANHTLWTSGGGQVVGWLNTKMFDETHDEAKSQGWTALIIDTNGNGKRDAYVEPNQPVDPTKDKRFGGAFYAVAPAPDGSVWGSVLGFPGAVVRLVPGSNPPETALAEVYEPPFDNPKAPVQGFSPRGDGRRSQRRRLGGARERPPGQLRSPQVQGAAERPDGDRPALPRRLDALRRAAAAAEGRDRSGQRRGELLHVGRSVRHARARREHADQHRQRRRRAARAEGRQVGRCCACRIRLGFYTKWMDGRIDDPNGRLEGPRACGPPSARARRSTWKRGKGTTSKVMHFQLRPDPLAK